jgi:hypothetical protein
MSPKQKKSHRKKAGKKSAPVKVNPQRDAGSLASKIGKFVWKTRPIEIPRAIKAPA